MVVDLFQKVAHALLNGVGRQLPNILSIRTQANGEFDIFLLRFGLRRVKSSLKTQTRNEICKGAMPPKVPRVNANPLSPVPAPAKNSTWLI
jgi:hypothetical protein